MGRRTGMTLGIQIFIIMILLSDGATFGHQKTKKRIEYYDLPPPLGGDYMRDYTPADPSKWSCSTCEAVFGAIMIQIRQLNETEAQILDRLQQLCPLFRLWGSLRIGVEMPSQEACEAVIARINPTMYYILKNRPQITPQVFCAYTIEQMGCNTNDPYLQWEIEIPKKRSAKNGVVNSSYSGKNSTKSRIVKILHLADIHLDLSYKNDAETFCQDNILCCHNDSESKPVPMLLSWFTSVKTKKAGVFGDAHKCDAPLKLLDMTLRHLVQEHPDIELIYMTGDLVPRNIHTLTIPDNVRAINRASEMIRRYFPSTPVIPAIGNHETHPVNLFSPPGVPEEINTMWVYNVTLHAWSDWITSDEQRRTFLKGGYFSVEMKEWGLKIVVINTNFCYGLNFWGMYKVRDPGNHLKWLVHELDKAERKGQMVHIVGHIPPCRSTCNKVWSRNYYNIISRYHSIIKSQFFGHTHFDELKLLYGKNGDPISSIFISPALTPYRRDFSVNPGYKLFYVHGGSTEEGETPSWDVQDYATHIFDLEEANKKPLEEPRWFELYRATQSYGLKDASFQSLGEFVDRMARNKTLFDIYFQYSRKAAPIEGRTSSHSQQQKLLCDMVQPYSMHRTECKRIMNLIDSSQNPSA